MFEKIQKLRFGFDQIQIIQILELGFGFEQIQTKDLDLSLIKS